MFPKPSFSLHTRTRQASTSTKAWPSKTHLRPQPTVPSPLPAIYPQKILLADGSTFTSYTTAPTPAILRLTRDVTNNPLWAPGTEKRGLGEGAEEGRVGRFRKRFQEEMAEVELGDDAPTPTKAKGFEESDFDWMSEGATEEKVSTKDMGGPKKSSGKKK
ncbi:hypothetical protein P7C73_g836, partial [Tremellales sp. Uapishka_1]